MTDQLISPTPGGRPWSLKHLDIAVVPPIVTFPDGRQVRGRGLTTHPAPLYDADYGVYLLERAPRRFPWRTRWVPWPDYGTPLNVITAIDALHTAFQLAPFGRVEIACAGGRGRTGCAIALMAAWAGVEPNDIIAWTRANYHAGAIETPDQERWVVAVATTITSPSTW